MPPNLLNPKDLSDLTAVPHRPLPPLPSTAILFFANAALDLEATPLPPLLPAYTFPRVLSTVFAVFAEICWKFLCSQWVTLLQNGAV
jgi:hypothetical protein